MMHSRHSLKRHNDSLTRIVTNNRPSTRITDDPTSVIGLPSNDQIWRLDTFVQLGSRTERLEELAAVSRRTVDIQDIDVERRSEQASHVEQATEPVWRSAICIHNVQSQFIGTHASLPDESTADLPPLTAGGFQHGAPADYAIMITTKDGSPESSLPAVMQLSNQRDTAAPGGATTDPRIIASIKTEMASPALPNELAIQLQTWWVGRDAKPLLLANKNPRRPATTQTEKAPTTTESRSKSTAKNCSLIQNAVVQISKAAKKAATNDTPIPTDNHSNTAFNSCSSSMIFVGNNPSAHVRSSTTPSHMLLRDSTDEETTCIDISAGHDHRPSGKLVESLPISESSVIAAFGAKPSESVSRTWASFVCVAASKTELHAWTTRKLVAAEPIYRDKAIASHATIRLSFFQRRPRIFFYDAQIRLATLPRQACGQCDVADLPRTFAGAWLECKFQSSNFHASEFEFLSFEYGSDEDDYTIRCWQSNQVTSDCVSVFHTETEKPISCHSLARPYQLLSSPKGTKTPNLCEHPINVLAVAKSVSGTCFTEQTVNRFTEYHQTVAFVDGPILLRKQLSEASHYCDEILNASSNIPADSALAHLLRPQIHHTNACVMGASVIGETSTAAMVQVPLRHEACSTSIAGANQAGTKLYASELIHLFQSTNQSWCFGDIPEFIAESRSMRPKSSAPSSRSIRDLGQCIQVVSSPHCSSMPDSQDSWIVGDVGFADSEAGFDFRSSEQTNEISRSYPSARTLRSISQFRFAQRSPNVACITTSTICSLQVPDNLLFVNDVNSGHSNSVPPIENFKLEAFQTSGPTNGMMTVGLHHAKWESKPAKIISPHFAGKQCTAIFVPQFNNVASYTNQSRTNVRRAATQIIAAREAFSDTSLIIPPQLAPSPLPTHSSLTRLLGGHRHLAISYQSEILKHRQFGPEKASEDRSTALILFSHPHSAHRRNRSSDLAMSIAKMTYEFLCEISAEMSPGNNIACTYSQIGICEAAAPRNVESGCGSSLVLPREDERNLQAHLLPYSIPYLIVKKFTIPNSGFCHITNVQRQALPSDLKTAEFSALVTPVLNEAKISFARKRKTLTWCDKLFPSKDMSNPSVFVSTFVTTASTFESIESNTGIREPAKTDQASLILRDDGRSIIAFSCNAPQVITRNSETKVLAIRQEDSALQAGGTLMTSHGVLPRTFGCRTLAWRPTRFSSPLRTALVATYVTPIHCFPTLPFSSLNQPLNNYTDIHVCVAGKTPIEIERSSFAPPETPDFHWICPTSHGNEPSITVIAACSNEIATPAQDHYQDRALAGLTNPISTPTMPRMLFGSEGRDSAWTIMGPKTLDPLAGDSDTSVPGWFLPESTVLKLFDCYRAA